MLEERNETHRRRLAAGVAVRPGVARTLSALKGKVGMAMVTSSPRYQIDLIHGSTGLLGYFSCIVTSDECPKLKPAPDAYLLAAERLGIPPERCLAVEDSYRGFSAARAAGIRCLLVPHELTDVEACAGAFRVESDVRILVEMVTEGGR
jgi:HAD superfamily hydrolase (TIGR01509 family)